MKKGTFTYFVYTCLVLLLCTTDIYGQLDIQQLTEQQGLGNNTVNTIHQDRKGFLWIGTDIGITRYGGNYFHSYNLSRPGGEPISISNIEETEDRYLWLESEDGILSCFDKQQEKYLSIQWNDEIKQEEILKLYSTGNTLYAILPNGLYILDVKSDGKIIQLNKKPILENKKLFQSLNGQGTNLYLTDQDNQLIIYHTQNEKSEIIDCTAWGIRTSDILNIYIRHDHLFVCGNFEGIICYNLKEKNFRTIKITNNQADYRQPNIREICHLEDNRFAISNRRFIYEMTFDGENYLHAKVEIDRKVQYERQFEKLIRNRITKLHYDSDNQVLWIGTYGNGLIRQNISQSYAFQIKLPENVYHINDIVQDADGYIWIGTRKHGILKSSDTELTQNTQFVDWKHADKDKSFHLQKDMNGFIWIGGEHGTIQKLSPITQELTSVSLPDSIKDPSKDFCIKLLYMNSRNRLWVATTSGIGIYDENTNQWLAYVKYKEPYGEVTYITEDAEGVMWFGTTHGVFEANVSLKTPIEVNLKGGFEEEAGLTANKVLSMHVTNTNQILVSYTDKIVRMEKGKIINHILLQKDIPYGHITCMIDDRNGHTWLGSNESVISIHNKTNMYFAFPLSGNDPIVCRLNDSKLLWGNMPDLVFFDPIKMKDLPRKKVYITDIEINARKMELSDQAIYDAKEIELTEDDHVRILFSKLNYNTVKNKTVYRILPTDTVWKENRYNEIVISPIEAGNYTLEIKPVYPTPGGEGTTTLKLNVSRHWVFSPMALIGYSIIVILISLSIYRQLQKSKKKKLFHQQKEQALMDELQESKDNREREKQTHLLRSAIQASIAQDLKLPLSIISNSLKDLDNDQSLAPEMHQRFKLAYRNSLYIQDACEQLVGIHKQELFQKKLEVAAYPIFQITDSVIRAARDIISACPINIDYGQHKDQTLLWIDFAKIEFTVKNMLSNAFRRIHYQGIIQCSINREIIDGQEFCIFRIMDDCKETESLLHQNFILGTSLMKDIAHRHHGNYRTIKKEEGTESLLYIPLGKEHFEKDENVVFVESQPQTQEEDLEIPVHELQKEEETMDVPTSKNKCKILIVDGNKDTRMFLKLQFANEYTVHLAKNGEEGIELARKILPDLVITEAILSGMDGFEVTRILKEDTNTCQIPIILLTTLNNNEDIIKGMELGADEYVRKPFDTEVLKSKVKRLIKNRLDLKRSYTKLLVPTREEETTPNGQENENMEDPLVTKVIQLINENIQNEDFSVKKLAEMLNMSQPTLYRKIKQLTNFTLIEVVRGVRLKRAAELLKSKKYNVQEAAEAVGYNDIPTFRKHFVDLYGITPSAFSKEENNEK